MELATAGLDRDTSDQDVLCHRSRAWECLSVWRGVCGLGSEGSRALSPSFCPPMQQDVRGLLCLRKRQGVGRNELEAEGLSQHNTYAEDRGLSLGLQCKV